MQIASFYRLPAHIDIDFAIFIDAKLPLHHSETLYEDMLVFPCLQIPVMAIDKDAHIQLFPERSVYRL